MNKGPGIDTLLMYEKLSEVYAYRKDPQASLSMVK